MKILASLVLAAVAGSPALAQTPEESGERVLYSRTALAPADSDWATLGDARSTAHATQTIKVDGEVGPVRTVKVEVASGAVHLKRVVVSTADGQTLAFAMDRRLSPRSPSAYVDLGERVKVAKVAVTTERVPRGTYIVRAADHAAATGVLVAAN
jgi:hypothetical protein